MMKDSHLLWIVLGVSAATVGIFYLGTRGNAAPATPAAPAAAPTIDTTGTTAGTTTGPSSTAFPGQTLGAITPSAIYWLT